MTNQLWQAPHNKDETPERQGRLADEAFEDQARHGSEGTDHGRVPNTVRCQFTDQPSRSVQPDRRSGRGPTDIRRRLQLYQEILGAPPSLHRKAVTAASLALTPAFANGSLVPVRHNDGGNRPAAAALTGQRMK